MYFCNSYPIVEKQIIADEIYSYTIHCPEVAEAAQSGQFVHIKAEGFTLRRPISICDIDKKGGTIRVVFEVRGDGTEKISQLSVGDEMDMIAPLGRGFKINTDLPEGKKIALVGGGIGVPPLLTIAKEYGDKAIAVIGFRTHDKVILTEDFKKLGTGVSVCTDDGTWGCKCNVLTPLKEVIEENEIAEIMTCGPLPMIKGVVALAKELGIPTQVSLEERMGCGVGACLVCTCKVTRGNKDFYTRVCKDGPVFKGEEVVFDD